MTRRLASALFLALLFPLSLAAKDPKNPTWWDKYQFLLKNGSDPSPGTTVSALSVGTNVDVSNECGPQSETFITINPSNPSVLAAGSNEIFRDPMRGYFSSDGGATWGGVDLALPDPIGTNGKRFGSDPSLAFDTSGNVFYGYIVVFFGNGNGVKGTEIAVARSTDGGATYPAVTYFSFETGSNHFNDKPIIAADTNLASPFRDNVYIAWDAAVGGSTSGGVRFARSSDSGATFTTVRVDDPKGPGARSARIPSSDPAARSTSPGTTTRQTRSHSTAPSTEAPRSGLRASSPPNRSPSTSRFPRSSFGRRSSTQPAMRIARAARTAAGCIARGSI
jgi:hypothetical protein